MASEEGAEAQLQATLNLGVLSLPTFGNVIE